MIRIDPEFRALCPPLTRDERDALMASLKDHGLLSPLVVWGNPDDGGEPILLDGHNRHDMLLTLGNPVREIGDTTELELSGRTAAARWIVQHQLGRRNLDASQRAMMAAKFATLTEGRPSKTAQTCAVSQTEAAKVADVSRRSVQHAAKVLAQGTPELVAAVEAGEVAVSAAAKVAEVLPPEQQTAVVSLPPAERAEAVGRVVHGPAETAAALAEAMTTNNGLKLMDIGVRVVTAELRKCFSEKWIATLNAAGRKSANRMLNELMNVVEDIQKELHA